MSTDGISPAQNSSNSKKTLPEDRIQSKTLWIGGLAPDWDAYHLRKMFQPISNLRNVKVEEKLRIENVQIA